MDLLTSSKAEVDKKVDAQRGNARSISFKIRWWVGVKVLLAAYVILLPYRLLMTCFESFENSMSVSFFLFLVVSAIIIFPLFAGGLFRAWVRESKVKSLIDEVEATVDK